MDKYIAVDSGKFATKIAMATDDLKSYTKGRFRTKVSEGNFDDDAIENNTYVCEIDGKVVKIGNGALLDAELETSKKSETHRFCTLLAIALFVDDGDDVHAAIGIPMSDYVNVEKRLEFKNYILPDGKVTVKYKTQKTDITAKTFNIVSKYVYPESGGGIYLDMVKNKDAAAVIDMGNLNVNATYFLNFEPDIACSITAELGGQILINQLAAELTSKYSRCDARLVSSILKAAPEERYLHPVRPNPEIEEGSKKLIKENLLRYVKEIKRLCDVKNWSLDYMTITFIGGTSDLLRNEIKEIFGDSAIIPERPEFANVIGFLRRLVAWEKDTIIEL